MKSTLLLPLKNKQFSALLIGQLTSRFGDGVMKLMLPLIVYHITNSLVSMGLVMTLMIVPEVLLLPFTGIIVDRFSRKKLMIIADLVRFILLSILTVISIYGEMNIYAIYFYAVLAGAAGSLFNPSYAALKAQLFNEEIRNSANALTEISIQLVTLIAPAIGGVIASYNYYSAGFGADAATFMVSVISLMVIDIKQPVNHSNIKFSFRGFVDELKEGYNEIIKHYFIKITILVSAICNIILASFLSMSLPYFIKNVLNAPDYYYGAAMSANSVGAILVAIIFGTQKQWKYRGLTTYLTIVSVGIEIGILALVKNTLLVMMILAVLGGTTMLLMLIWSVAMQELISERNFGKVASLDDFGSFTLLPIGYIAVGFMSQKFGIINMLGIESSILICIGIIFSLNNKIRRFN